MKIFNENINITTAAKLRTANIFKLQEYLTDFCISGEQIINLWNPRVPRVLEKISDWHFGLCEELCGLLKL